MLPLPVYNVTESTLWLKMASRAGVIDYERVMMETLLSFKRAGADIIITYHAKEAVEILKRIKQMLGAKDYINKVLGYIRKCSPGQSEFYQATEEVSS